MFADFSTVGEECVLFELSCFSCCTTLGTFCWSFPRVYWLIELQRVEFAECLVGSSCWSSVC